MKYLIEFKPLDRYFFGGEITFGENKNEANYFAKSNFMPQASTVLGSLRYEILRQKNLLNYDSSKKSDVESWIGAKSFSMSDALTNSEIIPFGIISNLSPLFIADKETGYYTAMPLDYDISFGTGTGNGYFSGKRIKEFIRLGNFDPKTYKNYLHWINGNNQKLSEVLKDRYKEKKDEKLRNIYTISEQIGIIKDKKEKKDEEAFFKQQLITLHPDLSFVCTVETTKELSTEESFVYMGANRSIFKISIKETSLDFTSQSYENYFYNLHQDSRTLLLSDTYVTDALKEQALFIWGESINFRSICKEVNEGISWSKPTKSSLYHLLPRGSVIRGTGVAEHLLIKNLQTVGMNIYL